MSNLARTFLFAAIAAAACFGITYAVARNPAAERAARQGNAMEWLRAEFHLSPAVYAEIAKLHDDYARVCDEHCRRILAARDRSAPKAEIDLLAAECVSSMTAHFQRVAALMPVPQGRRYLDLVLPLVSAYDHRHAPGVNAKGG